MEANCVLEFYQFHFFWLKPVSFSPMGKSYAGLTILCIPYNIVFHTPSLKDLQCNAYSFIYVCNLILMATIRVSNS